MKQKALPLYAVWCVLTAATSAVCYFYNRNVYSSVPYKGYVFSEALRLIHLRQ